MKAPTVSPAEKEALISPDRLLGTPSSCLRGPRTRPKACANLGTRAKESARYTQTPVCWDAHIRSRNCRESATSVRKRAGHRCRRACTHVAEAAEAPDLPLVAADAKEAPLVHLPRSV